MRLVLLLTLTFYTFTAFSQNIFQGGDQCFESGDYFCAQTKYKAVMDASAGKDKKIAEIRLSRAKWCIEHLLIANQAFNKKSFIRAKEEYQKIIEENPNDSYAASQLDKCNAALKPPITLSVSKENLSFPSLGGKEIITVKTNALSYSIYNIPPWCTLQKFQGYFILECNENSSTENRTDTFILVSGDKTLKINISQLGKFQKSKTYLSTNKDFVSFSANGGKSDQIIINSNASTYSISNIPSWFSVQEYDGYIIVSCSSNSTPKTRSDWFHVTAGDKEIKINVSQYGAVRKSTTKLGVSSENVILPASGGLRKKIEIYSNSATYTTLLVPKWCSVKERVGYIVISFSRNNDSNPRSGSFKVSAGDNEVTIFIKQEANPKSPSKSRCFNCPKTQDNWGLTAGYSQLSLDSPSTQLDGIQLGFRLEPMFKYGFGLNTGIIVGGYSNDLLSIVKREVKYLEVYSLSIPLNLEYRLNFSKWFNIFTYGGVGFNYIVNSSNEYSLPGTMNFGGGFRINHVQFNVGKSKLIGDFGDMKNFGKENRPFQNLSVSMSYMF